MRFIGDVHGYTERYLEKLTGEPSFQIGDMGVGFGAAVPDMDGHRFIRGNHDNPALCRRHHNYAGEYGAEGDFFFMGGAFSIDVAQRKEYEERSGRAVWWPDEELSAEQLTEAEILYLRTKPRVVATHECPTAVTYRILTNLCPGFRPEKLVVTRTGEALQRMFEWHQPEVWVFGHYHIDLDFRFVGTRFVCLDELSCIDLDVGEERKRVTAVRAKRGRGRHGKRHELGKVR
jgi:hypothetical protein